MDKLVITGICVVLVILLGFAVYADNLQSKWLAQHCQKIGEVSGSTGFTTTFTNGKVGYGPVYIPGKTGYKCDDGVERWE